MLHADRGSGAGGVAVGGHRQHNNARTFAADGRDHRLGEAVERQRHGVLAGGQHGCADVGIVSEGELRLGVLRVGGEGHGSGQGKQEAQLLREFHMVRLQSKVRVPGARR